VYFGGITKKQNYLTQEEMMILNDFEAKLKASELVNTFKHNTLFETGTEFLYTLNSPENNYVFENTKEHTVTIATLIFFMIYDKVENEYHVDTIMKFYALPNYEPIDDKAKSCDTDERTLRNYRHKYCDAYNFISEKLDFFSELLAI